VELKVDPPKALVAFEANLPSYPDPNAPRPLPASAKEPNPLAGFVDEMADLSARRHLNGGWPKADAP